MYGLLSNLQPDKIKTFTDRESMISDQKRFLPPPGHKVLWFIPTTTVSTGLHSTTTHVSLSPENRVTIETLTKNVDRVLTGKFFLCRCITPTHMMTSIMTVVDDPEGKLAVRLALYNYTNAREDLEHILPVGMILAIKNPWFKSTADGGLTVRCDNPGDVEVISTTLFGALFPNLKWQGDIPLEYRGVCAPETGLETGDGEDEAFSAEELYQAICSLEIGEAALGGLNQTAQETDEPSKKLKLMQEFKNLGRKHFTKGNFFDSIRFYTQALEISQNNPDVLVNRGAAYLNIGCYRRALEDLKVVLQEEPFHVKGIYRTVKSLWGLHRYSEALELLASKVEEKPSLLKEKGLAKLKDRTEGMLLESSTGKFDELDWLDIAMKKEEIDVLEIADYSGPVEIKPIPGKGRGLVAKDDINPGELIITDKAFAFVRFQKETEIFKRISLNFKANSINIDGHDELVELIAQKLRTEPELGQEFYKLYAGPEFDDEHADQSMDEVDKKQIDRITTYNAFSYIRTEDPSSSTFKESKTKKAGIGLWILPSYINHSCLDANCTWKAIGDVMFIRAVKQIRKGEEILISYTDPTSSYDERCSVFQSHSFTCKCLLCKFDSEESDATRQTRSQIFITLEKETSRISQGKQPNFKLIQDNLFRLASFYQECPLLNHHLTGETIIGLCRALFGRERGSFQFSADILEKGYPVLKNINALTERACSVSLNILGCYVVQRKTKKVNEWMEKCKTDLILAYGSIQTIRVYGPFTLQTIERFGYNFFD